MTHERVVIVCSGRTGGVIRRMSGRLDDQIGRIADGWSERERAHCNGIEMRNGIDGNLAAYKQVIEVKKFAAFWRKLWMKRAAVCAVLAVPAQADMLDVAPLGEDRHQERLPGRLHARLQELAAWAATTGAIPDLEMVGMVTCLAGER